MNIRQELVDAIAHFNRAMDNDWNTEVYMVELKKAKACLDSIPTQEPEAGVVIRNLNSVELFIFEKLDIDIEVMWRDDI